MLELELFCKNSQRIKVILETPLDPFLNEFFFHTTRNLIHNENFHLADSILYIILEKWTESD